MSISVRALIRLTPYTHYFEKEVEREVFEGFLALLPPNVYRAKGLIRFAGRAFPSLFQYTHGDLDIFFSIRSDVETSNVSVFIGDHFSKQDMANALRALELS
ncbi:CobW C-terminal domain-containing protein [Paenibacillus naphthalenovorans]|uniref:GTP-binding protein n=1 Tax=Paenibacillus naphthalenovorans TaxID=162209 RepID=UPI0010F515CF|nr:GTP-binding protein [Paenibacillus naphthalenovorans]